MGIKNFFKQIIPGRTHWSLTGINGSDNQLLKKIRLHQEKSHTLIVLYFDISRFREIEQVCGSKTASKLLDLVQKTLEDQLPRLLVDCTVLAVRNLWGDDFIAVLSYPGRPNVKKLQEVTLTSRLTIQQSVDLEAKRLTGRPLRFHVGYASISGNRNLKLESRIYSTLREAQSVAKGSIDLSIAQLLPDFKELIQKEKLEIVYQPIVSLHTARILGWESLVRGPAGSPFHEPGVIFDLAEKTDLLYAVERLGRKKAITNFGKLGPGQKLFLNIHPRTISDPGFVRGETLNFVKKAGLKPENVVFEITERHHIHDYVMFNETLKHYRKQGYLVAIDDMGAGFSSLRSIAEIKPDFLKIDMSLVRDIDTSRVKKALIETFTAFGEKMGCMIIAEGIETEPELKALIDIGVHYGQGYYLARQAYPKAPLEGKIIQKLSRISDERPDGTWGYSLVAKNIMDVAVQVEKNTPVKEIKELLDANEPISGLVVMDEGKNPVGLLMRHHLDHLLGSQYGIPLYYYRPVKEIMDPLPLIVPEDTPLEHVSQIAMNRERQKLYDWVIVTKEGKLAGIISIQRLLDTLTRVRVEIAKGANPLTGLPGNVAIEQQFIHYHNNENYSLVYIDLDNFKSYNDRYGFEKGDQVILFTARLLRSTLKKYAAHDSFLGHIGGDDFIIFVKQELAELLCSKIIRYFDRLIGGFYDQEDRKRKKYRGHDREGQPAWFPIMSISMAIIDCSRTDCKDLKDFSHKASQLKRYAKSISGSIYVQDRRNPN